MVSFADKPIHRFIDVADWERFLEEQPPESGVRLVLLKKAATIPGIRYPEALDVALCFGWIDGQVGRLDEHAILTAFTPRRARSPWSQINIGHVERLAEAGRMRPTGLAEVERARADGRWDAAYRQRDAVPPPDLLAAIDASPGARAAWDGLDAQNRFAMIFRTLQATRDDTRARRIAGFVEMLERGERIHPSGASSARPTRRETS